MTKTRDMLGMAILGTAAHEPLLALTDADFTSVTERAVFAALVGMIRDDAPIDVTTATTSKVGPSAVSTAICERSTQCGLSIPMLRCGSDSSRRPLRG